MLYISVSSGRKRAICRGDFTGEEMGRGGNASQRHAFWGDTMRISVCDKCYFSGKLKLADYRMSLKDSSLQHRCIPPRRRLTAHLCEEHLHLLKKEVSEEVSEITIHAYLVWVGYGFSLKRYALTQQVPTP